MRGTLAERFEAKVAPEALTGCWLWVASLDIHGYGKLGSRGAHRVSWELARGPVPRGLQLDHKCRNRACVNPDHLEPVTVRENLLRGQTHAARNAAKTHCKYGHPFSGENTRVWAGQRYCVICQADKRRAVSPEIRERHNRKRRERRASRS